VAAILRARDELELLFIRRAERDGDPWSGHVAFPGGRREAVDGSLADTARRETLEELAIPLAPQQLLGRLDDLAPRTRALPPIVVRPYIALVQGDVPIQPSAEVAYHFWVPLSVLRQPAASAEHRVTVNGVLARFPAYRVGDDVVWGLTERIVRQLLDLSDR
jgi:8-oxo-dGTP pyrophosphatase MutT (NUDIX family)